ncbi:uncharacterized protein LOC116602066 [Nematostella vectensis]|uniref:uncharacterized protein LOC116602066 n=1 Tax=Nematostella vectensis TaxID=45351 RepID=UPI0013905774|nr:uncharacterized protein LOC116602066 [Nematostella vectensis]
MQHHSRNCARAVLLFVVAFFNLQAIRRDDNSHNGVFVKLEGHALVNHVMESFSVTSPVHCGQGCLGNPSCRSYNIRHDTVCELLNTTKKSAKECLIKHSGSNHYHDPEIFTSCLDFLHAGYDKNGIFTITGSDNNDFKVFCDFTSELGSAWTLVLSFARKNKNLDTYCKRSLSQNDPRNGENPNWEDYRLSLSRMQHLRSQSTYWRFTTEFPVLGVDYRDYVRAKFSSMDVLTFHAGGHCKQVELVNIRGYQGADITAPFWQVDGTWPLHTDSTSEACEFRSAKAGSVATENNFGYYCQTYNPVFRGTATQESTTQLWFGAYL